MSGGTIITICITDDKGVPNSETLNVQGWSQEKLKSAQDVFSQGNSLVESIKELRKRQTGH